MPPETRWNSIQTLYWHLESLMNIGTFAVAWLGALSRLNLFVVSFLLKKSTTIYNRRQSKIVSTLTSQFTSSYVFHWSRYFPDTLLQYPPSFDGRIICYPTEKSAKDYFSWRQADSKSLIFTHPYTNCSTLSSTYQ